MGDRRATEDTPTREEFLKPWAMNYKLIGPMQREIVRLNFEASCKPWPTDSAVRSLERGSVVRSLLSTIARWGIRSRLGGFWNGDETDWGLNFGSAPVVLRVSLATY